MESVDRVETESSTPALSKTQRKTWEKRGVAITIADQVETPPLADVPVMSKTQLKKQARRNARLRQQTLQKNVTRSRLEDEARARWHERELQEQKDAANEKQLKLWQKLQDPKIRKCYQCKKVPMDEGVYARHVLCPKCERGLFLFVGARDHFIKVADMLRKMYPEAFAYHQFASSALIMTALREDAVETIEFQKKFKELWPTTGGDASDDEAFVEIPAY